MISVLIPIHNYEVVTLVADLRNQLLSSKEEFEIICLEDGSDKEYIDINRKIDQYAKISYIVSEQNKGRIKSRQQLSEAAQYDWLLFIDSDVKLKSGDYINKYLREMKNGYEAIFGGFAYDSKPPSENYILRWKYGRSQEEIPAVKRNLRPYKVVISANYIIRKTTFNEIYGKIEYEGYGYDNFFGGLLKENKVKILHIDNEVFHLGIEKSDIYLGKKEAAAEALIQLYNSKKINDHQNNLLKLYGQLRSSGLNKVLAKIHKRFKKQMKRNLLGPNPSIKILQLYRISYMCAVEDSVIE